MAVFCSKISQAFVEAPEGCTYNLPALRLTPQRQATVPNSAWDAQTMPQAKAARQNSIGRPPIARILWIQLLCVVMLASGFLLKGPVSAGSALAGGLIFLVPHAYFAYK